MDVRYDTILNHFNEFNEIVEKGTQDIHNSIMEGKFRQTVWIVCERISRWRFELDREKFLQKEDL